jgi:hypothetical protein
MVGGTTSGYWEMGSESILRIPTRAMRMAMTDERIGRVIKDCNIYRKLQIRIDH